MKKEHFLAGWELALDASKQCQAFLLTQAVDEETAMNLPDYIHLTYDDNDLLEDAKIYSEGELETNENLIKFLQAENAIGKLKYHNLQIHTSYDLIADKNGLHQIGGEFPANFIVPKSNLVVPFQYIGLIDNKDAAFRWLPFNLHLICPIYLNFDFLFLDYTNPLEPLIINKEKVEEYKSSYENDLDSQSEIVFNEVRFSTQRTFDYGFGVGNAGVAKWIQHPDIPRCPKTNAVMKFLCQFGSGFGDDGVMTKRSNILPKDEYYKKYYEKLNFWGDGELFVFFEPTSKVACYFIQNT
jgi:hypothetical protein